MKAASKRGAGVSLPRVRPEKVILFSLDRARFIERS